MSKTETYAWIIDTSEIQLEQNIEHWINIA